MVFSSIEFIFGFMPVLLLGFFLIERTFGFAGSRIWLILGSLFYYGWWEPKYVLLILASLAVNFVIGQRILESRSKALLTIGVIINLAALGYFKYTNFLVYNINAVADTHLFVEQIILPLGISFFTFQQIAYLADCQSGQVDRYGIADYALFVMFFPQLIAGPIVHHREMMPQFQARRAGRFNRSDVEIGLTIFVIGVFKKIIIADRMAELASPVFLVADTGGEVTFVHAWIAALAYTLQLYFDFSGYSDMAIGLARLFGIKLPINFASPYKATSIIDFWRRWHITLSRFLRDYLYLPLGGNRIGRSRRYTNLMIVMLLGGLWHGAGWNFVIWGGLHGGYLMINHGWRAVVGGRRRGDVPQAAWKQALGTWSGRLLTFLAVVVAWVFFRAVTLDGAIAMLQAMAGLNGIILPERLIAPLPMAASLVQAIGIEVGPIVIDDLKLVVLIPVLLLVCWLAPNSQEITRHFHPALLPKSFEGSVKGRFAEALAWRPNTAWSVVIGCAAVLSILGLTSVSEFIYFQF